MVDNQHCLQNRYLASRNNNLDHVKRFYTCVLNSDFFYFGHQLFPYVIKIEYFLRFPGGFQDLSFRFIIPNVSISVT